MAKKQGINYSPNMGLIAGERDVARSEAMMDTAGGTAFAQEFTGAIMTGIKEEEERKSIRDAYMADLGSIENINLLDEDYNKQQVTDFVRGKRDEYAKLAAAYARNKSTDILDKMNTIKFSFSNLNKQLQSLVGERAEYLSASDKGQLVTLGNGDEMYTDMYTNRSKFSVEKNGDIGFTSGNVYSKFKDTAGKWNVKNNIGETFTLEQNLNSKKRGESGKAFYRDDTKNGYAATFKQTGAEGVMVMAKTDLTGDNEYILPNGQKAGNLSFESMWSQGLLSEKFYKQIPKGTDSSWMYDKKNNGILNDIMSEYYTDVTESSYNDGKKNYKDPNATTNVKKGTGANVLGGHKTWDQIDDVAQDIKNKKSHSDLNGVTWTWNDKLNVFEESGGGKRTPQQLLSRNQIKYLYPKMFEVNTEFK